MFINGVTPGSLLMSLIPVILTDESHSCESLLMSLILMGLY